MAPAEESMEGNWTFFRQQLSQVSDWSTCGWRIGGLVTSLTVNL